MLKSYSVRNRVILQRQARSAFGGVFLLGSFGSWGSTCVAHCAAGDWQVVVFSERCLVVGAPEQHWMTGIVTIAAAAAVVDAALSCAA